MAVHKHVLLGLNTVATLKNQLLNKKKTPVAKENEQQNFCDRLRLNCSAAFSVNGHLHNLN